ncbi:hypothetical protein MtrunA17_Chr4g0000561 [Medicago truncatula]|uniref:Protein SDA1 n=1 Tax=Medicago truncatula TaxID=3880 RepID=A0A396I0B3_MEDTR|nr:hypothetical protein MtrunA17_Chr4g0000561 [Medicago truncatula]
MLWVLTYLGTKLMVKSIQFAKRVLVTLWELYQRKVWFDEKTANAICTAMGIKTEALSFLLENKKQIIEIDDSDSDDEPTESPQAIILDKVRLNNKALHESLFFYLDSDSFILGMQSEKLSSTNFMSCDGKLMVAEALGGRSEKLNLQTLQSKVERDPIGYILEVLLIHSQFNSSLQLFQQAAMNFISVNGIIDSDLTTVASDPTVAEDLAERAMFLTLVAPSYPTLFFLADFPIRLVYLLHSFAQFIPSMSRFKLAHALILLVNRQTVAIDETLPLLMELQTLGDKKLTRFVSQHLVVNIRRLKRPAVIKTQKLQSVMFKMLQEENEAVAKRVLVILWRLYQRKVWFDEKTANAICTASFHPALSLNIMILYRHLSASRLRLYHSLQVVEKDCDDSDSDDELPHLKENHRDLTMYQLRKLGNRLPYNRKSLQKPLAERINNDYYSPLNHMIDRQGFAEKLFSCLQTYNEESEVKMMMLKFIARIVGRHKLALLEFYPFPHQQDVVNLLAAVVEACHDEVFTAGLNAVREICIRMPLVTTAISYSFENISI